MNKPPDIPGSLETALANAAKGIVSIPCYPGTKVPMVKWKQWQTGMPPVELLAEWFADLRTNIAILTTGLVVFDCDDPAKTALVREYCGDTPYWLRSPRNGEHLGYRARRGVVVGNHVKVKGMDLDIRAENGLALIPPSRTDLGAYEWLGEGLKPVAELPVASIGWTRERQRRRLQRLVIDDSDLAVRRARAYLACVPGAVSGQRGHDKTLRAASILVQRFGLSIETAWPLLVEWNLKCDPPWEDHDLLRKLREAERLRSGGPGVIA